MYTIKPISLIAVSFTVLTFTACNQQVKREVNENVVQQFPAILNDSNQLSLDRSPMDMVYFPVDYPKEKMTSTGQENPLARVIYSRPQKNNRIIFADSTVSKNFIQQYGKEWRMGANEATEIEFFKPATIHNIKIPAGRYIMYCIPYPDKWKIIFNSNLYSWGLHMDKTKDIAETEVPVNKTNVQAEYFTMLFQKNSYGCDLVMAWGNVKAIMPISFN